MLHLINTSGFFTSSNNLDMKRFSFFRNIIGKVSNQLINILSIIEHIKPKLEVLAQSYPTEEQVSFFPFIVCNN